MPPHTQQKATCDWPENKLYVLSKTSENSKDIVLLQDTQNAMAKEFTAQVGSLKADVRETQVKTSLRAALIGAVVGIVPIMMMLAVLFFNRQTP